MTETVLRVLVEGSPLEKFTENNRIKLKPKKNLFAKNI
jgi:hypothetical protein